MSTEASKLNTAMQLMGVEAKWLQPFAVTDLFNDDVRLSSYLCQKPDHRYGALALLEVDGTSVPQLVLATPKLHYPFDRAGTFRFPVIKRIHLYEKLDGTNVLAYRYHDGAGARHLSYKLRRSLANWPQMQTQSAGMRNCARSWSDAIARPKTTN